MTETTATTAPTADTVALKKYAELSTGDKAKLFWSKSKHKNGEKMDDAAAENAARAEFGVEPLTEDEVKKMEEPGIIAKVVDNKVFVALGVSGFLHEKFAYLKDKAKEKVEEKLDNKKEEPVAEAAPTVAATPVETPIAVAAPVVPATVIAAAATPIATTPVETPTIVPTTIAAEKPSEPAVMPTPATVPATETPAKTEDKSIFSTFEDKIGLKKEEPNVETSANTVVPTAQAAYLQPVPTENIAAAASPVAISTPAPQPTTASAVTTSSTVVA